MEDLGKTAIFGYLKNKWVPKKNMAKLVMCIPSINLEGSMILEKNGDDLEDSCLVSFHVYFVSLDDIL